MNNANRATVLPPDLWIFKARENGSENNIDSTPGTGKQGTSSTQFGGNATTASGLQAGPTENPTADRLFQNLQSQLFHSPSGMTEPPGQDVQLMSQTSAQGGTITDGFLTANERVAGSPTAPSTRQDSTTSSANVMASNRPTASTTHKAPSYSQNGIKHSPNVQRFSRESPLSSPSAPKFRLAPRTQLGSPSMGPYSSSAKKRTAAANRWRGAVRQIQTSPASTTQGQGQGHQRQGQGPLSSQGQQYSSTDYNPLSSSPNTGAYYTTSSGNEGESMYRRAGSAGTRKRSLGDNFGDKNGNTDKHRNHRSGSGSLKSRSRNQNMQMSSSKEKSQGTAFSGSANQGTAFSGSATSSKEHNSSGQHNSSSGHYRSNSGSTGNKNDDVLDNAKAYLMFREGNLQGGLEMWKKHNR